MTVNPKVQKKLVAHYDRQQSDLISLDRLLKKRKPASLDQWLLICIERSKPYPLAIARYIWRINHD